MSSLAKLVRNNNTNNYRDVLKSNGYFNFHELKNTSSLSRVYVANNNSYERDDLRIIKFSTFDQLSNDWFIKNINMIGKNDNNNVDNDDYLCLASKCMFSPTISYNEYGYYNKGSLMCFLKNDQDVLTIKLLLNICIQSVKGIQKLHSMGIVHGDVHVSNILVRLNQKNLEYRAAISDFGSIQHTTFTTPLTRRECFSPQTVFKKAAKPSTDVWQLGHALYYVLTSGNEDSDLFLFERDLSQISNRFEIIKEHCTIYNFDYLKRPQSFDVVFRSIDGWFGDKQIPPSFTVSLDDEEFFITSPVERAYYQMALMTKEGNVILPPPEKIKKILKGVMSSLLHPSIVNKLVKLTRHNDEIITKFTHVIYECLYYIDFIRPNIQELHHKLNAISCRVE